MRPQLPLPPASLSGVWCAEGPANAHSVQLDRVIPLFSIAFRLSYFFLSGTRPWFDFAVELPGPEWHVV